jgi:hypothetical protein
LALKPSLWSLCFGEALEVWVAIVACYGLLHWLHNEIIYNVLGNKIKGHF